MRRFLGLVTPALALALAACSSSEPSSQTAPAAVASGDAGLACPTTGPVETTGAVRSPAIDETSGVVESKQNPGVFWVHNDSGDSARAFAIDRSGALLATVAFDTAPAIDIEDMAIEDAADGTSYLYFADIGDNGSQRSELVIHRVREPRIGSEANVTVASEKMIVRYGDAPHDAETLLFDPLTKDLLIATKVFFGSSAIHRIGPFAAGTTATTTRIAGVPISLATSGDISRDGTMIAIRNYTGTASLWRRAPGEDLATALARPACKVPIASEKQGEAFAFLAGGAGYATISEGAGPSLHLTRFQ